MEELVNVSVIIPCRNEEKFIVQCLNSIVSQDYPKDKIEVLVVDGESQDLTRDIVANYSKKYPYIKLLINLKKITPCVLNLGIKNAQGKIILRMDAHATYTTDYISKCVRYLDRYKADNVGAKMVTLPAKDTPIGNSIARCLSCKFGVGNSYFRTGTNSPRWVDTVFGGCYRREIFAKVGLFNENLPRGQDIEFNLRLKKAGLKTLLVPDIVSYYYAKPDIKSFIKHNYINGLWAILPFKYSKIMPVSPRSLIPLLFVFSLLSSGVLAIFFPVFRFFLLVMIVFYILINLLFSVTIAFQNKDIRYGFIMPLIFISLHLSYGLGSLAGLLKLLFIPGKEVEKDA